jgi:hypothetical protein
MNARGCFHLARSYVNWRSQLNSLQQGQDQIPKLLTCSNQFGNTVQVLAFIVAELERGCSNILFEMLQ